MNIDKIYDLRKKFTIIALTGRKGSGCGTVAELLRQGFSDDNGVFRHPNPAASHNSYRKYRIVYNYAKENFGPHTLISYKKILFLFILKLGYDELIIFLRSSDLRKEFSDSGLEHLNDFEVEIHQFENYRHQFNLLHDRISSLWEIRRKNEREKALKDFFISNEFNQLADIFFDNLELKSTVKRNKFLQVVGNNLRKSGRINDGERFSLDNVFVLATAINDIIKGFSRENKRKKQSAEIVIDSLRNPLEIMFFRQRFSAFYTIAVNRTEKIRNQVIKERYKKDQPSDIETLTSEEYSGAKTFLNVFRTPISISLSRTMMRWID
ncbi:MAG TPA: hypothetical protein VK183_02275 [Flavobacterium sp.]|nr:hypothetical protein [Flavobacterium sp.]